MADQIFGTIPGVTIGMTSLNCKALNEARLHRLLMAGIYGDGREGAISIVLNDSYIDVIPNILMIKRLSI